MSRSFSGIWGLFSPFGAILQNRQVHCGKIGKATHKYRARGHTGWEVITVSKKQSNKSNQNNSQNKSNNSNGQNKDNQSSQN